MKKRVFISFNEGRENYQFVRRLLESVNCQQGLAGEEDFLCGLYGRMFDAIDPQLGLLRSTLREADIKWSERIEHVYTDAELRSFPLLHLMVNRKEISPGGPSHGTEYDLSKGCPRCGCGAVQTSPFYAPPKSFPKSGLLCSSGTEIFVAEPLADALRRAETTGLELRQARAHLDRAPLPWWQMIPRYTMPKLDRATRGFTGSPECSHCQRDNHGHTGEPEELVYAAREVTPDGLPDVVETWERLCVSRIDREDFKRSRFADPAILVKPRVFDIFRRLKVRHAVFAPVRIEFAK